MPERNYQPGEFCGVAAAFAGAETLRRTAEAFGDDGYDFEVYSPVPDEKLVRLLRPHSIRNPVRVWTLAGGIGGGIGAFAMTIWMSANWPLIVGGKPIVSWPPFICVAFEMTVLYASLSCAAGFLLQSRLPRLRLPPAFRARFTVDRFGLLIWCTSAQSEGVTRRLHAAGAEDIMPVAGRARGRL